MADTTPSSTLSIQATSNVASPEAVWELTLAPPEGGKTRLHNRLLAHIRPLLEGHLKQQPEATKFSYPTPLYTIHAQRCGGVASSGGGLRLAFAPDNSPLFSTPQFALVPSRADPTTLPIVRLLDDDCLKLGQRLVGLEDLREEVLLRWRCCWDDDLSAREAHMSCPLPAPLREHFQTSVSLLIFEGDPGVGKSALARVCADMYCREQGISGSLLLLTTEARGDGTVGDFSRQIWGAFRALEKLPTGEFGCLLIDEADALAMARSQNQAHQEDRAATASILQGLDALAALPRRTVIMTTNRADALDAAVRRRATIIHFERPNATARTALLQTWLPHLRVCELARTVRRSEGMTPADMERALTKAWLTAFRQSSEPSVSEVLVALRQAERTTPV